MRNEQPLVIQIDTPAVTVKEFARRTGIPEESAKKEVQKGTLPILPKKKGERILINWVKWTQFAASQSY